MELRRAAAQQLSEARLALGKRELPKILAVEKQRVEQEEDKGRLVAGLARVLDDVDDVVPSARTPTCPLRRKVTKH